MITQILGKNILNVWMRLYILYQCDIELCSVSTVQSVKLRGCSDVKDITVTTQGHLLPYPSQ